MQRRLDGALRSELAFLGALYCVQGMPYGLQSGYLPLYMRAAGASYGLAAITRVLYVPWLLKFAWAPLVGQCGSLEAWLLGSTGTMGLVCLVGKVQFQAANCEPFRRVRSGRSRSGSFEHRGCENDPRQRGRLRS